MFALLQGSSVGRFKGASKMRIYELAKELGVENKVIITKAAELGMSGKASHSNALDPVEADQIRRAILRQAVGADAGAKNLFARDDQSVSRLKGGVIRRRKDVGSERPGDSEQPVENATLVESSASEGSAPMDGSVEPLEATEETVSAEVVEVATSAEVVSPSPETPVVGTDSRPTTTATSSMMTQSFQPREQLQPTVRVGGKIVVVPDSSRKDVGGPRVLGKIDVSSMIRKPAAPKPAEGRKEAPSGGSSAPAFVKDHRGNDDFGKKRTKRREISRTELVDYDGREMRRTGKKARGERHEAEVVDSPKARQKITLKIGDAITVGELAKGMNVKSGEVIAKLLELGVISTINQAIDRDTATVVAAEFDCSVESADFDETGIIDEGGPDSPDSLKPRAPVVTVMGHVDHGKTTLLDSIRDAAVASREHGGITQHIGAYTVTLPSGAAITFLDTPGHAAFTAMRSRGARVTDIVILVVAADDGVMPQTVEAIDHAKAAGVPIVVAVNKIDKPDSSPDRIKSKLAELGLQPEEWGGQTMFFHVSALKKQGLDKLLDGVLLQAEVKELTANPDRRARGAVIEARQDKGRGVVATVLVQNGTLKIGDVFVCGANYGRVRSMNNDRGQAIKECGPSIPVEITGFSGVPDAGDDFVVVESEAKAKQVADSRQQKLRAKATRAEPLSLEELARRANSAELGLLNVIVKADVHGSSEAIKAAVEKLSTAKVRVKVLHSSVGGVTETDVQLAAASSGLILAFGVRAEPRAAAEAEAAGIEIRYYRVIYELLDDVKKAMAGLLAPIRQESKLGRVDVRKTFNAGKHGTVAGCYVIDGSVKRGAFVRLLRDNKVVHEGKLSGLKRFKDDVSEVQTGFECGITLDRFNDIKEGDVMEVFQIQEVAQSID